MNDPTPTTGTPEGGVYDCYVRGLALLGQGSAQAAAVLLGRAHQAEPGSASIREALARAQFDARRYDEAERLFRAAACDGPTDDYAHYGLGLTLFRRGAVEESMEPLALAVAMRPGRKDYVDALRQARATIRARQDAQ